MSGKIAIVGMACRFPGSVTSPDEFWELLRSERDAVTEIPAERFGTDFYRHPAKREPGKSYTFAAGVLDDIAGFDAAFFGISPREAGEMDPQQRLLLELAWETFEDAGVRPADMRGRQCGVYVGVASTDYANRSMDDLSSIDPYSATGNTLSIASNRVSYLYDLRGPSMSIDTACSSSLVALHQAVQALQNGDAEVALAGGTNLLAHPFGFISFAKASMLSPRGRCRTFDASGDGYVRAEGGAMLLLKPLERALADGDTIHAVIAASGVNSDGFTQGGMNVPGAATQAALLRQVYGRAGIDVRSLAYMEAHGTGTAVGDPIETKALGEVAAAGREESDPLLIGSVKTNVGHLETASGMAGLFKAVLCLKHRAVPRTLHYETPNPNIDFKGWRLRVVDRYMPLEARSISTPDGQLVPLTVGVNSFGFGGTNAHVVLYEAPARQDVAPEAEPMAGEDTLSPLILTARSTQALAALARRYHALLEAGQAWNALAATAAHRRQWLEQRAIVAPAQLTEGRDALAALASGTDVPSWVIQAHAVEPQARTALVYSGNGSQWAGMGRRLYQQHALFRAALDEVDAHWCSDGSASLVEVMQAGATAEWLAATENAQPLLFAIQVGITRVLIARGVQFEAVLGHSVGEIAAAWADGALTLAEAVHVIKVRSRAQGLTRGSGRMAAAGLGENESRDLIERLGLAGLVEVAGINSPQSVTLVGSLQGLQAIEAALRETGQFFQILDLDYAFHSTHMDRIEPIVRDKLADLKPRNGGGAYVSTVIGERLAGSKLDAGYWWRNIREPVRFGAAIAQLAAEGVRLFIEVGPHSILRTYVKQVLADAKQPGLPLATLKREQDSAAVLEAACLTAIASGAPVDLDVFAPRSAPRIALPTYPWHHERHWHDPSPESYDLVNRRREHPLLGYRLRDAAWAWENQLDPARVPMLADHVVDGDVAFPGAGYVEMALAAARIFFETPDAALENLEIHAPVVFHAQQGKQFRFTIEADTARFLIETRDRMSDAAWTRNVSGRLLASGNTLQADAKPDLAVLSPLLSEPRADAAELYEMAAAIGLDYGPAFRWVTALRLHGDAALADIAVPSQTEAACALKDLNAWLLHPALMDSGFHPLFALLGRDAEHPDAMDAAAYVPVQVGRVDYRCAEGDVVTSQAVAHVLAQIERRSPHSVVASFTFLAADFTGLARLSACRFRRVDLAARRAGPPAHFSYVLEARPLPGHAEALALPAPAALLDRASARLAAPGGEDEAQRMHHLTEVLPLLDVLASQYALAAFDQLELFERPLNGIAHPQLVERLAAMLVEDGLAHRDRSGTRLIRNDAACAQLPAREELWRGLLAEAPDHIAELTLLAHCGAALPRVLRGEVEPNQVLTSTGRSLVEHFFEASPTWSHVHRLMGACAEQALDAWRSVATRRLRVLEIDATDSDVLRPLDMNLPEVGCDRILGGSSGQVAGFDAAAYPGVRTEVWPAAEGEADAVDLILVARVLAGQADPEGMLQSLRARLVPGGQVICVEARRGRFGDIVFGLSEADGPASESAGQTPARLAAMFERAGFTEIARHAEGGLELEGTPAFVIARKPSAENTISAADDLAGAVAAADARWLILHAVKDDARACALLAERFTKIGGKAEVLALDAAPAYVAALPPARRCELVFVAPFVMDAADADGKRLMHAQETGSIALARLVRELGATGRAEGLRLNVVTRGGAPFPGEAPLVAAEAPLHPEQASLWGLGRVLANEYPEWSIRLIDLHPGSASRGEDAGFDALACELGVGDEEEVLLNRRGRWVPRMLSADEAARRMAEPRKRPAMLAFEVPGSLRNLEWFALPDCELEDDEVEIEPVATGLNFRDVMYAMGLLSDEAVETGFAGASVGMELSGRVKRVGSAVRNFAPGDAVLGFAPASFATQVRTRAAALARKPSSLSFEAAATIPTTFFTAYYALVELARIRRGERVLVHGGAGGVGIAATQIARHFGAEVFATAGSDEKREFVALLGADHVLDSRSLAFADDIRTLTNGEGIDIVLNSLAGEAMVRSIDTLRPFGRFLELGKRDFYENSQIGLRPFRNNISYFGIDADQLMGALPDLTARLFGEVMELFGQGVLHALPYRAFPAAQVEEAFRYMQQARQIGKVLVTYTAGVPAPSRVEASSTQAVFDAEAAYLVIGGTGGFGFATARWMIERGARHLVLASRSGKLSEEQRAAIVRWQAEQGAHVEAVACDATDAAALARLVSEVETRGTPIRGVVHTAMQIDDGLLRNLDDERFAAVLAPKVAGAWNLHRVLEGRQLDCFIVYSSATTFLGNPGQANYVAANSFLEALVAMRRAAGLPGLFMAWGPIEDVGFLARNAETRDALQARIGGASISSDEALAALDAALVAQRAGEAVVRIDWQTVARGMPAARARRYALMQARGAGTGMREGGSQLRAQVCALPQEEAQLLVAEALRAQIARILHLSPERIELDKSVLDMGMDSLMGMELGMAVEENFEVRLSVMAIADGATVQSLAARIVGSILAEAADTSTDGAADHAAALARSHALDGEARAKLDGAHGDSMRAVAEMAR
jgi:phthiocerol/phenolphthiocerol synthesis type-I polyketide synthase C